jgi:hypothetical protein
MEETKLNNVKCCNKCLIYKNDNEFANKKNFCKLCSNEQKRIKYNEDKIMRDSKNEKRRLIYKENEEYRKKLIQNASEYKHNKVIIRQQFKSLEKQQIGLYNKKCNYCLEIKHQDRFRYNRLKCRDCERDEPIYKFKRTVRSRIYISLKKKDKHTIHYLGCNSNDYLKWMLNYNTQFTLDNQGQEWHIDHVIPLYYFDLENEDEQLIAFNWRNTMPLLAKENLSKNKKIIKSQIQQHLNKLKEYHKEHKLDLPQVFINLFAKHLDDGNPLKLTLPLTNGNICKDLG